MAERVLDQVCRRVELQPGHQIGLVVLHSFWRDSHAVRNFFVGEAGRDQFQNLALSRRQATRWGRRGVGILKLRQIGFACQHCYDRMEQLADTCIRSDEGRSPCRDRFSHGLRGSARCQKDELGFWEIGVQPSGRPDALPPGKFRPEDDHVRFGPPSQGDEMVRSARRSRHLKMPRQFPP